MIWSIFGKIKKESVQDKLFSVNHNTIDSAIRSFGALCQQMVLASPSDQHSCLVFCVTYNYRETSVTLSMDTRGINLLKYIPGFKYANSIGWSMNENYIEGTVTNISSPYTWDGFAVTDCIIKEFQKGYPNANIVNHFDAILDTGKAGVIFRP